MGAAVGEAMATTSALLFGRRTWQGMAAAWPAQAGDPFADRMNEIDKHVVSRTLTQDDLSLGKHDFAPPDDIVATVRRLRDTDGGDCHDDEQDGRADLYLPPGPRYRHTIGLVLLAFQLNVCRVATISAGSARCM
jgi:hypothetical protein